MNSRLATGLVLGLTCLSAIFIFPFHLFEVFVGAFMTLAAYEWGHFLRIKWYGAMIFAALFLLLHLTFFPLFQVQTWLYAVPVVWILAVMLMLPRLSQTTWVKHPLFLAPLGLILLLSCFWSALILKFEDPWKLLYVFLLTTLTDTGAYYAGKYFGKHRLAPELSPKKTWEGAFGGLCVSSLAALIMCYFRPSLAFHLSPIGMLGIAWLIIIVSILGDLFESYIKRQVSVKDSGSLLPGHGGVLDRIDSLCATMPVYLLCALLFQ